jgi:hypothetical protein
MKRRWIVLAAIPISLVCLFLNEIECFIASCAGPRNSWFSGWLILVMGIVALSLVTWLLVLPVALVVRKHVPAWLAAILVGATCAAVFTAFLYLTQGPVPLLNAVRYLFLPLLFGWAAYVWLVSKQWPNPSLNTDAPPSGGAPVS